MTRKDVAMIRIALLTAVNQACDMMEASLPQRTAVRPAAEPEPDVTDLDRARARKIMTQHGMRK